ncbi:MAG: hypothetical protein LBR79_04400 [Oscillospiraceae bacterium]|nr:hypothetical protein [Oscillospiraceae bacterium]
MKFLLSPPRISEGERYYQLIWATTLWRCGKRGVFNYFKTRSPKTQL